MKVPYTLKASDKLVLRILQVTGTLHYKALERVLLALQEPDWVSYVRLVAEKPRMLSGRSIGKSDLERRVTGMVLLGLIEESAHLGEPWGLYGGLGDTIRDRDLTLTSDGESLARRIGGNRRLVLRVPPAVRTTIFVACAFGHNDIDRLYERHIQPVCTSIGYEAVRVDMSEPEQSITDAIIQGITECACVVADLTYARPSVYFEVGLAHGLGVPLLLTCRKDHHRGHVDERKVHFDLEQYKISYWSPAGPNRIQWPRNMRPSSRLAKLVRDRQSERDDE